MNSWAKGKDIFKRYLHCVVHLKAATSEKLPSCLFLCFCFLLNFADMLMLSGTWVCKARFPVRLFLGVICQERSLETNIQINSYRLSLTEKDYWQPVVDCCLWSCFFHCYHFVGAKEKQSCTWLSLILFGLLGFLFTPVFLYVSFDHSFLSRHWSLPLSASHFLCL